MPTVEENLRQSNAQYTWSVVKSATCSAAAEELEVRPKVSFIVPCYKFGHFLEECIHSILEQTLENFEILIMDDCSPDNTPEVAASLTDRRIRYVRNEDNLGHLQNYNKGITLAWGEYIWLISADDRLRKPYVLERYVRLMEKHSNVGYVFCRGLVLEDGCEKGLVDWALPFGEDEPDSILGGREFLHRLLTVNQILAPAVLARAECYRTIGLFPLDMPFAGDWYLWCAFALHYDVAYFAEPMVNYRLHNLSMTNTLRTRDIAIESRDLLAVCWRMKEKITAAGHRSLERHCKRQICHRYFAQLIDNLMNLEKFELSLDSFAKDAGEREAIEKQVLGRVVFRLYLKQEFQRARGLYNAVHSKRWTSPVLWADYIFLKLGRNGIRLARAVSLFKRQVTEVIALLRDLYKSHRPLRDARQGR
jgi:glycosyltransferase involved in cell wall biosynthesis